MPFRDGERRGRASRERPRRLAVVGLAGGALATIVGRPTRVAAKSKHKGLKRCKAQVAPCQRRITAACAQDGCAPKLLTCCDFFATCDSGSAIQCIATNSGDNAGPNAARR